MLGIARMLVLKTITDVHGDILARSTCRFDFPNTPSPIADFLDLRLVLTFQTHSVHSVPI